MVWQRLCWGLLALLVLAGLPATAWSLRLQGLGVDVHGFADVRSGVRTQNDSYQDDLSLGEGRLQLEAHRFGNQASWTLRTDFVADAAAGDRQWDLDAGTGAVDVREANVLFTPTMWMDIKLGRQILTWGTGDMLFINDLFPKDWQSFFTGRDAEYLKAPSDAVMVSLFPRWASIDLVYTPAFDSDRYVRGERLSYYNAGLGRLAGEDAVLDVAQPNQWFTDDEWSLRISRNLGGLEAALYAYSGYWKSPGGSDPVTGQTLFPKLHSVGASVRTTWGDAIVNAEVGYYYSADDADGDNAFIKNSELRLLLGYERELGRNFTVAGQYYLEWMQDYGSYRKTLPAAVPARDEYRQVVTLRLTKLALSQNLELSLFTYLSPTDQDLYARPYIGYKATDAWLLFAGGNLFAGDDDYSFFGQFENNSNVYAGVRYNF